MKNTILVSVSGGRTSAFMAHLLIEKHRNDESTEIICVFANTGQEHPKTIEFLKKCDEHFGMNLVCLEAVTDPQNGKGQQARVVPIDQLSMNGEPFEAVIRKHGIPNVENPNCSRDMKERPIRAYMRSLGYKKGSYKVAIGFRADEPKRLNWKKAKEEHLIYPLADTWQVTRYDVNKFWSMQPFDLEIKSYEGNCKTCWKKSRRKLLTIAIENPDWFDFFQQMELEYENYIPKTRQHNPDIIPPFRFFRGNTSVADIFEEAALPFDPALDESKEMNRDKMMMLWNEELDTNDGCTESCEPF